MIDIDHFGTTLIGLAAKIKTLTVDLAEKTALLNKDKVGPIIEDKNKQISDLGAEVSQLQNQVSELNGKEKTLNQQLDKAKTQLLQTANELNKRLKR